MYLMSLRNPERPPVWVRTLEWLAVAPRLLFGVMFVLTGSLWFRRANSVAYLTEAFEAVPRLQDPQGFYDLFLTGVVLEHPGVFVALLGMGELLTGVSLLLGYPRRAGALGGIFLTANYGFAFANPLVPPAGNFLLAALLVALLAPFPYRRLAWRGPWEPRRRATSALARASTS